MEVKKMVSMKEGARATLLLLGVVLVCIVVGLVVVLMALWRMGFR